jgi:hypothetical protein
MKNRIGCALVALGIVIAYSSASGHHNGCCGDGSIDPQKAVKLNGVVEKVELVNPHSKILVGVSGRDSRVETWLVELPTVSQLDSLGWKKETFKAGMAISITVLPVSSVSQPYPNQRIQADHYALLGCLTLPGGKQLGSVALCK